MKLSNLHTRENDGLIRAAATVTFENCNQPEKEIFIQTEAGFADGFIANPHAVAVGCIIPALHFGERRLLIEQPICPYLKENLATVMAIMHHWTVTFPICSLVEAEIVSSTAQLAEQ